MKDEAGLRLERALGELDLGRLPKFPKVEVGEGLDVVRVRVLPLEREGETRRRLHRTELPSEEEGVALGRLHLDPVALAHARLELHFRDGEALRPPPLREHVRLGERLEDERARGGKGPRQAESTRGTHPNGMSRPIGSGTCIVIRAGGSVGNVSPNISLTSPNVLMSATRTVTFTTSSGLLPPAFSTASTLRI